MTEDEVDCHILTLPMELVQSLYTWLPIQDITRSQLVCKEFRAILDDEAYWNELCHRDFSQHPIESKFRDTWKVTYQDMFSMRHVRVIAVEANPDRFTVPADQVGWIRYVHKPTAVAPASASNTNCVTLDDLQHAEVVICYSNSSWGNQTEFGNHLADFVDGGGGVVVCTFSNCASIAIKGRFESEGYHPIPPTSQKEPNALGLGQVLIPSHPLMEGVDSLKASSSSYRCPGRVVDGVETVALWEDDDPLLAWHMKGNGCVVLVNCFPPVMLPKENMEKLVLNAIRFAGRHSERVFPLSTTPFPVDKFSFSVQKSEE